MRGHTVHSYEAAVRLAITIAINAKTTLPHHPTQESIANFTETATIAARMKV
jgi:hypothetical protein